jgi:serine/threonine protein kinase
MAPEIHLEQPYDGKQVDLFAAGVILFVMVSGSTPFSAATPKDIYFKALALGDEKKFWNAHSKNKAKGFYSEEFKNLINNMLRLDPNDRPNID